MTDISALQNAGKALTESYSQYVTDKITQVTNAILKLKALKDIDYSEAVGDALDDIDDLGDAIAIANELGQAFGENPLVAQLTNKLQDEYGWDMTSSLSVVNALVNGKSHPLINVVSACMQSVIHASKHLYYVNTVILQAEAMLAAIEAKYGPGAMSLDTALSTTTNIPEDIYNDVQAAKAKLAYALRQTPVNMTNYNQSIDLIDEAMSSLGAIDIRSGMEALTAAGAAAAFDILFKGLQGVMKERLRAERDARNKFQDLYTIIVGTKIEAASNNAALARPAKALADLSKVARDMINSSLVQSAMIPQYLLTLGAVKQVLKLSSPIEEDPEDGGASYSNQSITFDFAPTNNLNRVLARIFTFTRSPSNTSYLAGAVSDAKTYYAQLETEYADFELQVGAFLATSVVAPVVELIGNVTNHLEAAGLDAAKTALQNGDLESLLGMDEFTGTTYGQAYTAIEEISKLAYKYNLFDIKKHIDKMKKKFQKKAEAKKMDNDSKKKEKLAKLKATIEGALSTIDELVTIGEEVTGMIDAISAITIN